MVGGDGGDEMAFGAGPRHVNIAIPDPGPRSAVTAATTPAAQTTHHDVAHAVQFSQVLANQRRCVDLVEVPPDHEPVRERGRAHWHSLTRASPSLNVRGVHVALTAASTADFGRWASMRP